MHTCEKHIFVKKTGQMPHSAMDERFDGVRDGCNPLKLYRLNKYRKGAVLGGG